jgi:hypothetical protein
MSSAEGLHLNGSFQSFGAEMKALGGLEKTGIEWESWEPWAHYIVPLAHFLFMPASIAHSQFLFSFSIFLFFQQSSLQLVTSAR